MAADLVGRRVSVIATFGTNAALAAKVATTIIPIVFVNGGDPIASGLVESLNRPGGNVTGVNMLAPALNAKRLELLHEVVPQARTIAMLVNPRARNAGPNVDASKTAATALGAQLVVFNASTDEEIEAAFAELSRQQISALIVGTDIFLNSRSDAIVALAARHSVPAIYGFRRFALAGGLMSYGTNDSDAAHHLDAAVTKGDAKALIIVAPPRALGVLRHAYSPKLRAALKAEIDKDYVKTPIHEIEKQLFG